MRSIAGTALFVWASANNVPVHHMALLFVMVFFLFLTDIVAVSGVKVFRIEVGRPPIKPEKKP